MSVWPGVMFSAGYALAFLIVAIVAETPQMRNWALCTMTGTLVGGALTVPITLALLS